MAYFPFLSRYADTLWACALDVDISLMDRGDMTNIGEKGANLSGGQRARLALARYNISLYSQCCYLPTGFKVFLLFNAIRKNLVTILHYRAIYHGSDVIVLDDVLSAVDAQVARWILNNAILGPLLKEQTRLLCTHNIQVILIICDSLRLQVSCDDIGQFV